MSGKTIDDGGAAFPMPLHVSNGKIICDPARGMTLREWYAGQAMQGLCASGILRLVGESWDGGTGTIKPAMEIAAQSCAWLATTQADALIAALKGEK